MLFYYLDKIVEYRLKQKNKKLNLKKAASDLSTNIKGKIFTKPQTSTSTEPLRLKEPVLVDNIPPAYKTKDYTTIVLSKKKIEYIKKHYSSFFIEYALAKELSENGYSTLVQSAITKGLRKKNIF